MISARFLKETADEVAIGQALIFQTSFHQANFSEKWRKTIVTPIFTAIIRLRTIDESALRK